MDEKVQTETSPVAGPRQEFPQFVQNRNTHSLTSLWLVAVVGVWGLSVLR